jgi:hypothetical protein
MAITEIFSRAHLRFIGMIYRVKYGILLMIVFIVRHGVNGARVFKQLKIRINKVDINTFLQYVELCSPPNIKAVTYILCGINSIARFDRMASINCSDPHV